MRWQKAARTTIAIAVVVFTAVVFVALRRGSKIATATNELAVAPTPKAVTRAWAPSNSTEAKAASCSSGSARLGT